MLSFTVRIERERTKLPFTTLTAANEIADALKISLAELLREIKDGTVPAIHCGFVTAFS